MLPRALWPSNCQSHFGVIKTWFSLQRHVLNWQRDTPVYCTYNLVVWSPPGAREGFTFGRRVARGEYYLFIGTGERSQLLKLLISV